MTRIRPFPIVGLIVLGVLATTAGVARAQVAPDGLSPAPTTSVRLDLAPVPVPDRTPTFSVKLAGLKMGETPVQGSTQNRAQGIGFGVEAGIGRNSLSGDEDNLPSGTATMFGIWVGGNKAGRVGFTGEFLYVIRKVEEDGDELKYNALEIPAVFHVNFGRGGPEDPMGYALVGPVFTINLKQKLNGIDVSEGFNGADFGLMIGGGVEIFRIAFEVRYNMGMRSIDSDGEFGDIKGRQLEFVVKFRISGS